MKYSFTVTNIYVFRSSRKNIAYLHFNQKKVKGFVGYKGIGKKLREGDMITPLGTFSFLEVYYRPDKNNKFKTILPKKKFLETLVGVLIQEVIHTILLLIRQIILNVKNYLEKIVFTIFSL